ncbi:hypothetical protein IJD44_07745 [bacterium]|nr:hypothetical protein [bacterium]
MTKDNLIKIKEYDTYILFQHKDTGIRECFMKSDLEKPVNKIKTGRNKWERKEISRVC